MREALRLFLFVILIPLLGTAAPAVVKDSSANQKKLVIVGDSLTEGYGVAREAAYPAVLEKILKKNGKNWTVVNAGISGSTTASAVSRLNWILKSKPDLLILALGANDGLRGVKLEETRKNLTAAMETAQTAQVKVILAGLYLPPNYGKEYSNGFHKIYTDLSKKYHSQLIEFLLEGVGGDPKLNQADGIHPNEKGHAIVANHVYESIKGDL